MIGAIIYARFSSEKQNEQSIEGQLRVCNQYAEQNGLTVLDTYIDRAMTGTNDNRPAFQQMLSDCEKPVPWDVVLVYAIDRFGRNSIEIAVNKQRLKKNKKTLISATQRTSENIDGSKNLDGILLENVYIGLAEYYSAELSQKVKRGMRETRSKGLFCGGQVAYGYRIENKKVRIDEDRAEVVRYVFSQYVEGRIIKDIKAELTAKGVLYKGKPFATNTLYDMLRAEKYIGIHHSRDGNTYLNIYPPIISKELFDEVQRILAVNKIGSKSVKTEFLLKGKCACGICGKYLQGESGTSRNGTIKYYYKCAGRKKYNICDQEIYPKELLEQLIIDVTMQVFGNSENIGVIADAVMKAHEKRMHDKSLLNILNDEKDRLQKSLANVMKAIEQGIFNITTKARMDELEQQLADVEEKIALEEYKAVNQIHREQVIEYLTHTIKSKPNVLLYTLIQRLVIFKDRIEVYYNYIEYTNPDNPDTDGRDIIFIPCSTLIRNCAPLKKIRTC